jgi:hypothetical protein
MTTVSSANDDKACGRMSNRLLFERLVAERRLNVERAAFLDREPPPHQRPVSAERVRGMLFGLAICDALGNASEWLCRGETASPWRNPGLSGRANEASLTLQKSSGAREDGGDAASPQEPWIQIHCRKRYHCGSSKRAARDTFAERATRFEGGEPYERLQESHC